MSIGSRIVHEIREIGRNALFFFVWFLLLMVVFKLLLDQYDIHVYAISKAALAAIILGKTVVLLNNVWPTGGGSERALIMSVVVKTLVYTGGVAGVLLLERLFESFRETGTFSAAWTEVAERGGVTHVAAVAILISLALFCYNIVHAVSNRLGEGELHRLLFSKGYEAPRHSSD